MSQRTNAALADAWLTADVALSRKKRKDEISNKQDEYDLLLADIIAAQQVAIDANSDAGFYAGLTAAAVMVVDQWANISTGGLWSTAKALALVGGAYSVGEDVGQAAYQGTAELFGLDADINAAVADLENMDWVLSNQANKYQRSEGDDALLIGESNVESQVEAFEGWADEFYSWEDEALSAAAKTMALDTSWGKMSDMKPGTWSS